MPCQRDWEAKVRNWIILIVLAVYVAGCSGGKEQAQTLSNTTLPTQLGAPVAVLESSLPPLPVGVYAQLLAQSRTTSMELITVIPGAGFYLKSDDAHIADSSLYLTAPSGELAWGVYGIPGLTADYRPLEVELQVFESDREYYVALADYDNQRWQILPELYLDDSTITFDAGWQRYLSPVDSVYFAVLAWDNAVTFNQAVVLIEDSRPLPAPTGLVGTPQSLSALLEWDLYSDSRADEMHVYQSGNSNMSGASLVAYFGPGVTSREVGGLTNGSTYFFALKAYMNLDDLTSPYSNIVEVTPQETGALPAPTNLSATPLDQAAELGWDAYADSRATALYVYQSNDSGMAGAEQVATLAPDDTSEVIEDLVNDQRYYFALKAYASDLGEYSAYSNIASTMPQAPTTGPLTGIWPRLGNREDNRGVTAYIGPHTFDSYESVNLAPGSETINNRTSPVIDADGNVYALSGDGVLASYTGDLATRRWKFDAAEHGTAGVAYVCPPHSPIIDGGGNVYFIATAVSTSSGTPYLFSVDSSGGQNWRFDMGIVSDDITTPYPTPNIAPNGDIVVVIKEKHVIVGVKDGEADWAYELGEAECHADPSISRGMIEFPVYDGGIGIPENRLHWLSLNAGNGDFMEDYRDMGTPQNYYSGLPLAEPYYAYPENTSVVLIDAAAGTLVDHEPLNLALTAPLSRSSDGVFIFQPHPPFGFAAWAYLHGIKLSTSEPPSLSNHFTLQLDHGSMTSKPAVDGAGKIYLADGMGKLFLIGFDPDRPVGEENPTIIDQQAFGRGDTYCFNSFAIGDGVAYIVTEQNVLYLIYDAVD